MKVFILIWCVSLICFKYKNAQAQVLLTGKVVDADGGQLLATANIRAKNTFFATISNEAGAFLIKVPELPVTLIITHIGYADQEVLVNEVIEILSIRMQPISYELDEIVATPDYSGVEIMQKVMEQKRQWRSRLTHFKALAYTRQTFKNEMRIVGIREIVSKIHWDRDKGIREVVLSKRHTQNVPEKFQAFSVLKSVPNFYDDEIPVQGARIIGPTHPETLNFYHFQLVKKQYNGKQIIYEVSVKPKTKLQPTFTGRLFILDETFAILRAELKPSHILSSAFARDIQVDFIQQFQNFGAVWLPIDFHMQFEMRMGIIGLVRIPTFKITQITDIKDFEVNKPIRPQLYKKKQIVSVDSISVREDSLFTKFPDRVPLSEKEKKAHNEIDSTLTFRKAFPATGPLSRWVNIKLGPSQPATISQMSMGWRPLLTQRFQSGYNRVNMAKVSLKIRPELVNRSTGSRFGLDLGAEYTQGLSRWPYSVGLRHRWGKGNWGWIQIGHRTETEERYHSYHYGRSSGTVADFLRSNIFLSYFATNNGFTLLGFDDYYDYYWRESTDFEITQTFLKRKAALNVGFHDANHSSLSKQTDFNILGRYKIQRLNPPIDEGRLRYIDFRFLLVKSLYKRVIARVEWSSADLLKSDFSYAKYELGFDWRIETFLKRRANPNVLDIRVTAGTFTGDLPVQRFGVLDVWRPFTSFGTFKHLSDYPYEGEKYVGLYWQHNFRSAPFEIFNMRYMRKNGFDIILYGGSGRTWISKEKLDTLQYDPHVLDKFYHEAGISLSFYRLIRLDATKRLDKREFSVRVSMSRLN